jgi:hypothetical protein
MESAGRTLRKKILICIGSSKILSFWRETTCFPPFSATSICRSLIGKLIANLILYPSSACHPVEKGMTEELRLAEQFR